MIGFLDTDETLVEDECWSSFGWVFVKAVSMEVVVEKVRVGLGRMGHEEGKSLSNRVVGFLVLVDLRVAVSLVI